MGGKKVVSTERHRHWENEVDVVAAPCALLVWRSRRIQRLISAHSHSLVLELQQRAVEFGKILTTHDRIK